MSKKNKKKQQQNRDIGYALEQLEQQPQRMTPQEVWWQEYVKRPFRLGLEKPHISGDANGDKCIVFLPGRGETGHPMMRSWKEWGWTKTLFVALTPVYRAWYPMPNGEHDQDDAVAGIPAAIDLIESTLARIRKRFPIPKERTALVGYSAGAVMALQVAAHSSEPYAAAVSHAGAILDPESLPPCKHEETGILLTHYMDDWSFSWEERFLPMYHALLSNGYSLFTATGEPHERGGHNVYKEDLMAGCQFVAEQFGMTEETAGEPTHG